MNTLIQMQAIIEAPYYEGEFFCPWPVPEFRPFARIRLWEEITNPEVGLVFAQLAQYNQIKLTSSRQVILQQILKAGRLVLPGGIQVIYAEDTIEPSCCCGLETWREWIDFLQTGQSPWLGHDPSPWVEGLGEVIRIWSDGGIVPTSDAESLDVSRTQFEQALARVEKDLQAFLWCIEPWAQTVDFEESGKLAQKFDQCFSVGGR